MVEKASSKTKEAGKRSNLPLDALVDKVTLSCTGFNYAEPSAFFPRENGGFFRVFISDKQEIGTNPNIVIVEDQKQRGAVRWKEWYFGTFEGEPISRRKDYSVITDIIQPSNKVSGFELEERLRKFI